nr:MAG TPA: hypothetical protein [Caudoviricetes sp.]
MNRFTSTRGGRFFYFLTRYAKPTSPHIYTRE